MRSVWKTKGHEACMYLLVMSADSTSRNSTRILVQYLPSTRRLVRFNRTDVTIPFLSVPEA